MKKTRYTEEQIAYALGQAETGTPMGEVIRKMGISTQTFYRGKKQYWLSRWEGILSCQDLFWGTLAID